MVRSPRDRPRAARAPATPLARLTARPPVSSSLQAVSKRVQNAKSNKFHANVHKRGNVPTATVGRGEGDCARCAARRASRPGAGSPFSHHRAQGLVAPADDL